MQRQLGVFIYDLLSYFNHKFRDLEDFLEKIELFYPVADDLVTKIVIPHRLGREIFERLEIMGVTATLLFQNHEGAAADVVNAYHYDRRTGRAWDV